MTTLKKNLHPSPRRRAFTAALSAVGILLTTTSSKASSLTWAGATDGLWGTDSNWTGTGFAPTSSDDLTILGPGNVAGALNINIAAAASANSISFTNTSATTLTNTTSGSNQTLTLGAGGLTTGTGAVTIGSATALQNVNIALGASQTWNVGSGGLTATNVISGVGFGITKSGAGTLTLSGANTYSGGTTLSAGTLLMQGNSTPTSGTVTSGPLGTGTLTLNGGTLGFVSGASYTIANNVSVTGATNIQVASGTNEVLNGNWSGSGNITLVANGSTGQWQFGGDNSGYTGTLTQNTGNTSLAFNSASAGSAGAAWVFNNSQNQRTRLNFGTGTINFGSMAGNGSIANVAASGMATVSVGALNTSTTFSGILGGTTTGQAQNIALTKVGNGTLTLTGANTFTGGTTISAGTLALGSASSLTSATGALTVNGGTLSSTVASTTLGGNLTLSGGSLVANGTSAGTLVLATNKNFSMTSGTFSYSLNDTVTGSGMGTFSVTGGTFDLTNSITDYSIAYSVFSGFSSGSVSGLSFTNYDTVNYVASLGTNGQLTFSAIPEPATYTAIVGALALAGVVWNRRRTSAHA